MPRHTPEEQARRAADASTQPGLDRSGGAAANQDDAGLQARFQQWREYLNKPEIQAGLLQFSVQMLQPTPAGFGAGFGQALGSGLAAAGRFKTLERTRGQEDVDRRLEDEQQELENTLAERRVSEQERRGDILERGESRRGVGKDKEAEKLDKDLDAYFESLAEIGGPVLDPFTLRQLKTAAKLAVADGIMVKSLSAGLTVEQVARAYLDPATKAQLIASFEEEGAPALAGETVPPPEESVTADPDAGLSERPTGGRGGVGPSPKAQRITRLERELEQERAKLDTLERKGVPVGRGSSVAREKAHETRKEATRAKILELEKRIEGLR